jgi:AraC-like DNA-binding protein
MTFFLHVGISVGLFAMALALSKRPNQVSDKIFVAFILSIIFPMLMRVLGLQALLLDRIAIFMPLTLGPFMLYYTESLITQGFRLRIRRLWHLLPFGICLPVSLLSYRPFVFRQETQTLQSPSLLEISYVLVLLLSFLCYALWIYRRLVYHRRNVLNYFTQTSTRITLGWLSWVVLVFFNIFILVHIPRFLRLLNLVTEDQYFPILDGFHSAGFVLFLVVLSFFAVRQSQVFREPEDPEVDLKDPVVADDDRPSGETAEKKEKQDKESLLKGDQLKVYLDSLENYMQAEKPYLGNDLTLAQLAAKLQMPKHHLTEVINRRLEKNFFNYVNEYRIAEVKQLLQDPDNAEKTILTLAFDVGFNSKTTFNTFFKKTTQMTPSQYRKQFPAA